MNSRDAWTASGLFFLGLCVYVLSSPGRVDAFDGQLRYEVASNLVHLGRPVVDDPFLPGIKGVDGRRYAWYGAGASVAGLPLAAWGSWGGDPSGEAERFYFSLTSAFFGAGLLALLFRFYRRLGVDQRKAVFFSGLFGVTTLVWPLATSTLDQVQHAFWLLLACYFAHRSAVENRLSLALAGGLAGAAMTTYQETLVVLLPVIALAAQSPREDVTGQREGWVRYLAFGALSALGLLANATYNFIRLGVAFQTTQAIDSGEYGQIFGNPLVGLAGLLLSPGKSVFLYSPPVLLFVFGLRAFWRSQPRLGSAVIGTALVHLMLTSSLAFYGGDWAWGPRYLVVTMPLLALALPFGWERAGKRVAIAIATLGLTVQLLSLSIDMQRFFFERGLNDHFWVEEPAGYFKLDRSALFSRVGEIWRSARDGAPAEATGFSPGPYPRSVTYCTFGNSRALRDQSPQWMRQFAVFYWPRPWPLWWPLIAEERRPSSLPLLVTVFLLCGAAGAFCVRQGLRQPDGKGPTSR